MTLNLEVRIDGLRVNSAAYGVNEKLNKAAVLIDFLYIYLKYCSRDKTNDRQSTGHETILTFISPNIQTFSQILILQSIPSASDSPGASVPQNKRKRSSA